MGNNVDSIVNPNHVSKHISYDRLSTIVDRNILFVEKYIDSIDETFKNGEEREIVYRELGSIVYSCIEAILKYVLVEINNRCNNRSCTDGDCKYRRYRSNHKIDKANTFEVLIHLLNTRLIGLPDSDIDHIRYLNEMRNYIHISKNIDVSSEPIIFDKSYVYSMLDYYYEFIYQIDLADFYFASDVSCLKELDTNGFDLTMKQTHNSLSQYYLIKLHPVLYKLFNNQELTLEDKWIIKSLNNDKVINIEEIGKYICREANYYSCRHKSEEECREHKLMFINKLLSLINNKKLRDFISNNLTVD